MAGISHHDDWYKWITKLDNTDNMRVQVAIEKFQRNPHSPGLNLEKMVNTRDEWWTIRASQAIRIAMIKADDVYVLVRAGHHEMIDNFVNTSKHKFNAADQKYSVIEIENVGEPIEIESSEEEKIESDEENVRKPPERRKIFRLWQDEDLLREGIPEEYLPLLRSCESLDDFFYAGIHHDLPDWVIDLGFDLLEKSPSEWKKRPQPLNEEERKEVLVKHGEASGFSKFFNSPEELQKLMSGEIERWMVWLHPRQWNVVEANYSGPARVGGAAGTGKTVVALHRAAELAKRFRTQQLSFDTNNNVNEKIVFLTYNNNIPDVLESLYLAIPGTKSGEVEFTTLNKLANRAIRDAGLPRPWIETGREQFDEVFNELVISGTPLHRTTRDFGPWCDYLFDEIESVIKGRSILSEDEYLEHERIGRQHTLGKQQRRQIWKLYSKYQSKLNAKGIITWIGQVQLALDVVTKSEKSIYRAAIVDEVQDISQVGLQLIRKIVNGNGPDKDNGILIVGDGAQRIYSNFCSLQQAGIDIRGRSTILRKNYRNTREILDFALAVAGDQSVEDLGTNHNRGESIEETEMSGGQKPELLICENNTSQIRAIENRINDLMDRYGLAYGDFTVLARHNSGEYSVNYYLKGLRGKGISCTELNDYDGTPSEGVRIGTYFKVKGLESKVIFIPDLTDGVFLPSPQKEGEPDESYSERLDLELNQFWVASTRARDHLIMTCNTEPSEWVMKRAEGLFTLHEF